MPPAPVDFKMDSRIEQWQMQPGEPPLAYYCFTVYRDLGPKRTLEKCAEKLCLEDEGFIVLSGPDKAVKVRNKADAISIMSPRYNWQARCRAYDAMMDREMVQARLQGQREAARQAGEVHQQVILGILGIAGEYIKKFHDKANPKFRETRVEELTVGDLVNIATRTIPLHRVIIGADSLDESAMIGEQMDGRHGPRLTKEEMKNIAREAAIAVKSEEPSPEAIVLEPPTE